MTHDQLTNWARRAAADPLEREMADRLDRYREALERARGDINWLLSVQGEIPGARIGSQYLDKALK
jgi:hypothetical protein